MLTHSFIENEQPIAAPSFSPSLFCLDTFQYSQNVYVVSKHQSLLTFQLTKNQEKWKLFYSSGFETDLTMTSLEAFHPFIL